MAARLAAPPPSSSSSSSPSSSSSSTTNIHTVSFRSRNITTTTTSSRNNQQIRVNNNYSNSNNNSSYRSITATTTSQSNRINKYQSSTSSLSSYLSPKFYHHHHHHQSGNHHHHQQHQKILPVTENGATDGDHHHHQQQHHYHIQQQQQQSYQSYRNAHHYYPETSTSTSTTAGVMWQTSSIPPEAATAAAAAATLVLTPANGVVVTGNNNNNNTSGVIPTYLNGATMATAYCPTVVVTDSFHNQMLNGTTTTTTTATTTVTTATTSVATSTSGSGITTTTSSTTSVSSAATAVHQMFHPTPGAITAALNATPMPILSSDDTYICCAYSPRCFIIQKVKAPPVVVGGGTGGGIAKQSPPTAIPQPLLLQQPVYATPHPVSVATNLMPHPSTNTLSVPPTVSASADESQQQSSYNHHQPSWNNHHHHHHDTPPTLLVTTTPSAVTSETPPITANQQKEQQQQQQQQKRISSSSSRDNGKKSTTLTTSRTESTPPHRKSFSSSSSSSSSSSTMSSASFSSSSSSATSSPTHKSTTAIATVTPKSITNDGNDLTDDDTCSVRKISGADKSNTAGAGTTITNHSSTTTATTTIINHNNDFDGDDQPEKDADGFSQCNIDDKRSSKLKQQQQTTAPRKCDRQANNKRSETVAQTERKTGDKTGAGLLEEKDKNSTDFSSSTPLLLAVGGDDEKTPSTTTIAAPRRQKRASNCGAETEADRKLKETSRPDIDCQKEISVVADLDGDNNNNSNTGCQKSKNRPNQTTERTTNNNRSDSLPSISGTVHDEPPLPPAKEKMDNGDDSISPATAPATGKYLDDGDSTGPISSELGKVANLNDDDDRPMEPSPANVQGLSKKELFEQLRGQLEYYFSYKNLSKDQYLLSQMDDEQYVDITIIANFDKIKRLTNDIDLVVRVLRSSSEVSVNDTGTKVKPDAKRRVVILRDVPDDIKEDTIFEMFKSDQCPVKLEKCEFAHNQSYYLYFHSDEDAQKAMNYLRDDLKNYPGSTNVPILARIKAKPTVRHSATGNNGHKPNQPILQHNVINGPIGIATAPSPVGSTISSHSAAVSPVSSISGSILNNGGAGGGSGTVLLPNAPPPPSSTGPAEPPGATTPVPVNLTASPYVYPYTVPTIDSMVYSPYYSPQLLPSTAGFDLSTVFVANGLAPHFPQATGMVPVPGCLPAQAIFIPSSGGAPATVVTNGGHLLATNNNGAATNGSSAPSNGGAAGDSTVSSNILPAGSATGNGGGRYANSNANVGSGQQPQYVAAHPHQSSNYHNMYGGKSHNHHGPNSHHRGGGYNNNSIGGNGLSGGGSKSYRYNPNKFSNSSLSYNNNGGGANHNSHHHHPQHHHHNYGQQQNCYPAQSQQSSMQVSNNNTAATNNGSASAAITSSQTAHPLTGNPIETTAAATAGGGKSSNNSRNSTSVAVSSNYYTGGGGGGANNSSTGLTTKSYHGGNYSTSAVKESITSAASVPPNNWNNTAANNQSITINSNKTTAETIVNKASFSSAKSNDDRAVPNSNPSRSSSSATVINSASRASSSTSVPGSNGNRSINPEKPKQSSTGNGNGSGAATGAKFSPYRSNGAGGRPVSGGGGGSFPSSYESRPEKLGRNSRSSGFGPKSSYRGASNRGGSGQTAAPSSATVTEQPFNLLANAFPPLPGVASNEESSPSAAATTMESIKENNVPNAPGKNDEQASQHNGTIKNDVVVTKPPSAVLHHQDVNSSMADVVKGYAAGQIVSFDAPTTDADLSNNSITTTSTSSQMKKSGKADQHKSAVMMNGTGMTNGPSSTNHRQDIDSPEPSNSSAGTAVVVSEPSTSGTPVSAAIDGDSDNSLSLGFTHHERDRLMLGKQSSDGTETSCEHSDKTSANNSKLTYSQITQRGKTEAAEAAAAAAATATNLLVVGSPPQSNLKNVTAANNAFE